MSNNVFFSRENGNLVYVATQPGGVNVSIASAIDGAFESAVVLSHHDEHAFGLAVDEMLGHDAQRIAANFSKEEFRCLANTVRRAFNNEGASYVSAKVADAAIEVLIDSGLTTRTSLVRLRVPSARQSLAEHHAAHDLITA